MSLWHLVEPLSEVDEEEPLKGNWNLTPPPLPLPRSCLQRRAWLYMCSTGPKATEPAYHGGNLWTPEPEHTLPLCKFFFSDILSQQCKTSTAWCHITNAWWLMQNKCIFLQRRDLFFFFEVFSLPWFQIRFNKSMAHDDHPQWTYDFSNPLSLLMEHKTEEGNIIGLRISADHTRRGWKGGLLRAGINVS